MFFDASTLVDGDEIQNWGENAVLPYLPCSTGIDCGVLQDDTAIGVRAPSDLGEGVGGGGVVTFLPEKVTHCPNVLFLELAYKYTLGKLPA